MPFCPNNIQEAEETKKSTTLPGCTEEVGTRGDSLPQGWRDGRREVTYWRGASQTETSLGTSAGAEEPQHSW